jgi:hypothetical protein
MRRSALLAVVAGLVVVLVGTLAWWRPFVTTGRAYPASIPQPAPLFSIGFDDLAPGQRVCMRPAVIDSHSERAVFRANTFGKPGSAIHMTIAGDGYRVEAGVPGGYADNQALAVPVRPPRHDVAVSICFRNAGRRKIALFGANDRTQAPLTVTRDGKGGTAPVQLAFYERKPVSILERLPTTLSRIQVFRPGIIGLWLLWPLALVCVLGVPLGALWALWHSVVDEEAESDGGLPLRVNDAGHERPAPATGLRRAVDVLRGLRPRAGRRFSP